MGFIPEERIKKLNHQDATTGDYVVYWMQASQRTQYNHSLEYAIYQANKLKKPLIVYFGITDDYPEANRRHYHFLLEGLKEVKSSLEKRGIQMVVLHQSPEQGALEISESSSLMVTDRGYLDIQRKWRDYVVQHIKCPLIQVEGEVVVPVETASDKEEYSAATIRKKIKRNLERFMVPVKTQSLLKDSLDMEFSSFSLEDVKKALSKLKIDNSVREVEYFHGGTGEVLKRLENFLKNKLDHFKDERNDPTRDYLSHLSPYLHFGQISPLHIVLKVSAQESPGKEAFFEELVVRRELSMNFVFYNPHYYKFACLPHWAKKTLLEHENDKREYIYSRDELERAETHDPYWNAAEMEMVRTGKMHGYMRMYWGKKILEWVDNPREAFDIALYLNNKYEIDGRDPNGFTGVAWCFGKHDRAWKEREIFGKVRYMNANGLRRKFKIDQYVDRVNALI
jgi:deoxyribodipyrimidine photo-lyase